MKFTEIRDPLDGERTVEVHPRPAPLVEADWARQRFVTGRSVSAEALDDEMDNRSGRTRLLGRALRPGVVFGLEVGSAADHDGKQTVITVAPGMGICASGEDVVVPRAMVTTTGAENEDGEPISALDLPFHRAPSMPLPDVQDTPTLRQALAAWADLFAGEEAPEGEGIALPPAESLRSADLLDFEDSLGFESTLDLGDLAGPFEGDLPAQPWPFLAVLVVEPVVTEEIGAGGDADDPCERDPASEPFEDWRYVDGARLAWYAVTQLIDEENAVAGEDGAVHWATWFQALFGSTPLTPDQQRNRAAWGLFDADVRRNPAPMPWERESVPVALVAFANGEIRWIDASAVTRRAGRFVQGESPVPSAGDPALWQARIEQFNAQLSAMTLDADEKLATHLRWLPPAGILPRELYDFRERLTSTFPSGWGLSAAPIPVEQLDEVLRHVAPLAPFDLRRAGDEVKLLVPVDASNWDPRLLQIAAVHPEFHTALREAERRIEILFAGRGELRSKIATLYGALGGAEAVPEFPPDEDPEYQHEWVHRTVLWGSADAASLFHALGQVTSGPILTTADGLKNASILLLWSATAPATDTAIAGTEVKLLADAFVATGNTGPVAVVPMAASDPVQLESGPGFEIPGGWTHASMVNREDGLAFADDPWLYVVAGTADTEALDRAIAWAGTNRLVVLATGLTGSAVEELHWHHHRHPERLPLVCVANVPPEARQDFFRSLVARVGAVEVAPNEHGRQGQIGLVLASQSQAIVVGATGGVATTIAAEVTRVDGKLAALPPGPSAARAALDLCRRILTTNAAVLKVPDAIDPDTAASRVLRTRLAAEVVRRMQRIPDMKGIDGTALLRLTAPARQPDFDTAVSQSGLGSVTLHALRQRLEEAVTPPDGLRVVSQPELALLQDVGIVGLMGVLGEKVDRADDVIDFAFVQIQALTFRIREYLLGRDAALAASSSPILADLADLIQRDTDPDALQAFFDALKAAAERDTEGGTGGTSGGALGGRWFTEAINLQVSRDKLYDLVGGFDPRDPLIDLNTLAWDPALINPGPGEVEMTWWSAGTLAKITGVDPGLHLDVDLTGEPLAGTDLTGTDVTSQPDVVSAPERESTLFLARVADSFSAPKLTTATATETFDATKAVFGTKDVLMSSGLSASNLASKEGAVSFFDAAVKAGTTFAGPAGEPQAGAFTGLSQSFDVLSAPLYVYNPAVQTKTVTKVASVGVAQMVQSAKMLKAMHPVDWTLRSSGIKKRVQDTKAVSLRSEAFRLRGSVTQTIHNLALNISGLLFPGFVKTVEGSLPQQEARPLDKDHAANVKEILEGKHDLISADADYGDLISDAVKSLETTAALLRIVEARIREVRGIIGTCAKARSAVEARIKAAEARHDIVDRAIAEAKHDLTVTRALLAEERQRVDETNARRQKVLDEEVPFVVFHRPRAIDLHDDLPVHDVEPSLSVWNVLREAFDGPPPAAPPELREAVDLWRDAPARWLRSLGSLLERIDQVRAARRALEHARMRAAFRLAEPRIAPPATLVNLKGLALVSGLVSTRKTHMVARRQAAASLDLQFVSKLTWKQAQVKAAEVMTLDDVVSATDIPAEIPKRVSQEIEWIYAVAAHLYAELTLVEPFVRADWARRMSEFDQPLDLRDLSALPHWAEVGQGTATSPADPFRKRELQAWVDWLFGRLHAEPVEDSFGLMNDLVRICILLSAHAPVGQILAGHVEEPTPVEPGRLVPIRLDVSRLRVGMQALVTLQGVVQARAVVEDLADGIATARLVSAAKPGLVLQKGDPVRFVEPDGVAAPASEGTPGLIQGAASKFQLLK